MVNRADELLLCPDCRDKVFKTVGGGTEASECGCYTSHEGVKLCARCAYKEHRCRSCGADLTEIDDAARRHAIRARRRRELKAAIKAREPLREEERENWERKREESGRKRKTRQRHRR